MGSDCYSGFCDFMNGSVCGPDPCLGSPPYPTGCDCASGIDCLSGFCDSNTWMCSFDCGATPYPDGCPCTTNISCQSGFCDMVSTPFVCASNCGTAGAYGVGCDCTAPGDCASMACDLCSGTCVNTTPPDIDGDGVPDGCDQCQMTYGDMMYDGCPETCLTCP